jgi:hypothetical protein
LVENLGTYGARWAWVQPLSQYALAPITQVNGVSDEVINAFKVKSQGAADNDDLSVDWFATGSSAGVAHIYQSTDPQWWWKPTVNITDDRPVVEVKVGSGNWTDSGVDADPDPDPATPGNQNDTRTAWLTTWTNPTPTTAAPLDSPGNSSGRFRGSKHISDHEVGTMVRVKVVLHISVSGDVDNATVEAWKVRVAARLVTPMHGVGYAVARRDTGMRRARRARSLAPVGGSSIDCKGAVAGDVGGTVSDRPRVAAPVSECGSWIEPPP